MYEWALKVRQPSMVSVKCQRSDGSALWSCLHLLKIDLEIITDKMRSRVCSKLTEAGDIGGIYIENGP